MSAAGFCETCGGHGTTFREVSEDVPGLTAPMRKRLERGRPAILAIPCPSCDGIDHATGLLETEAETRGDAA